MPDNEAYNDTRPSQSPSWPPQLWEGAPSIIRDGNEAKDSLLDYAMTMKRDQRINNCK